MWRSPASIVSRSSAGSSCSASQARPRTPNRSLTGARLRLRMSVAWIWFLAFVRGLDELCPPADPSAQDPGRLVDDPHLRQEAAGEERGQRPCVDLVRLGPDRRRSLDGLWVREDDPRERFDQSSNRECVAGRLEGDHVFGAQVGRPPHHRRRISPNRPAERTRPASAMATSQKSRWTSSPMQRMPASFARSRRRSGLERQLRIRALGTPGQSQGRPATNRGLSAHRKATACPPAFSLKPLNLDP